MSAARQWLREHLDSTPDLLLETMLEALGSDEGTSIPEALARGAVDLYRRVLDGAGDRNDALPLLAADALFTAAFQAQAEIEPGAISDFARRWGGEKLTEGMLA